MQNLPPVIAGALAGFMQQPVLTALQRCCAPDPNGLFEHRWQHATGHLTCHLDYEAPDDGAPDRYGLPTHAQDGERMVLIAAYCNGVDIEHLIGGGRREAIEQSALDAWHHQRDEARADAAVD